MNFKNTFTTMLGRQLRSARNARIATINVKINFRLLKAHDAYRLQSKLCEHTFARVGLEDTVYI
jgi:hypothetical protein